MFDGKVKQRNVNFHSGNKRIELSKDHLVEQNRKLREARALEKKRNAAATQVQRFVRRFVATRRCTQHLKAQLQSLTPSSSVDALRVLSQISFVFAREKVLSVDDVSMIATLTDAFALPFVQSIYQSHTPPSEEYLHAYQTILSAYVSLCCRCLVEHPQLTHFTALRQYLRAFQECPPPFHAIHSAAFRLVSFSIYQLLGISLGNDPELSNICSRCVLAAWSVSPNTLLGTSNYYLLRSYYYFAVYVLPNPLFAAETVQADQWGAILTAVREFPQIAIASHKLLQTSSLITSPDISLNVIVHWLRHLAKLHSSAVHISNSALDALVDALYHLPITMPTAQETEYDSDMEMSNVEHMDNIGACVSQHRRVVAANQPSMTSHGLEVVQLLHGAPAVVLIESFISTNRIEALAPLALILVREVNEDRRSAILNSAAYGKYSSSMVSKLWASLQASNDKSYSVVQGIASYIEDLIPSPSATHVVFDENQITQYLHNRIYPLYFLLSTLHHQLKSLDDITFLSSSTKSLPVNAFVDIVIFLRDLLYHTYYVHPIVLYYSSMKVIDKKNMWAVLSVLQLLYVASDLFRQLCIRNDRLKFIPLDAILWRIGEVSLKSVNQSSVLECTDPRLTAILRAMPQVVPFRQRVELFEALRQNDRERDHSAQGIFGGTTVRIERSDVLGTGFNEMGELKGGQLKQRVRITFVSEAGLEEPGIDGGGLYKEFMDLLFRDALSPSRRLFSVVEKTQMLTPNPQGRDQLAYYNFLGKLLGKAVYEGVLVETMFCVPFWNRILGRHNLIDDLKEIDEELYTSLIGLRNDFIAGKSSVQDLGLTFEITSQTERGVATVPLLPSGGSIPVTSKNVISYVYLYAHYKLNRETHAQCRAFLAGFQEIIPQSWIQLFSPREMLTVVGGDTDRGVDLDDLIANCTYSGGYHPSQPYVQAFWALISSFTKEQLGEFLKFVTSCSRQPLLGFKQLQPPFNICKVPAKSNDGEASRLPQASACFNQFKLPQYDSIEEMTEKVMYAIMSKSGFEMS